MKNNYNNIPEVKVPASIDVPEPQMCQLENGIKLYTLDCSEQDVIRVSLVFHAGTSTQHKPFCASSTANMLSEGSKKHSAKEIAEWLDYYGSYYDVSLDRDYAVLTFVSLSKFFERTLEIAHEILLEPQFPEEELESYRSKRKERLSIERSKVSHQSRELFGKALFGQDHPYGAAYAESEYDNLTRSDLLNFYRRIYTSDNCFVVSSGKIKAREIDLIAKLASQLKGHHTTPSVFFPEPQTTRFLFHPHQGAVQSAIRVGRILFPRTHPDFIPMQITSTILGGYFGSRLVHNLREEHGFTYGVFSSMINFEHDGYFAISTEVGSEVTSDAVEQILIETQKMRTELVDPQELDMVRNIMTGEVMRVLDGPFGIADVTIENIQNRTDNSYLELFLKTVKTITPEEVLAMARKYLDPDDLTIVVVGEPGQEQKLVTSIK